MSTSHNTLTRERRHKRIRARIGGTPTRPRLSVYKSNRYLHAQVIDDAAGTTLAAGSTKEWKGTKMESAEKLGAEIAKRAKAVGISTVVFDRGGFRYTGRVAKLAEAARGAGLEF
jgi:large subunit ribosomal protein L18